MTGSMVTFPANGTTTAGYLATPAERRGPRRAGDPGVVGARPSHQARLRPLRRRGLRRARARHVPRPDRQRARRGRQALHGAQHRPRREGPARGRDVPPGPVVHEEGRGGGILHGRPARALRGDAQSRGRRVRELLRHPPERQARLREAGRARARALRRAGRLRDTHGRRGRSTPTSRRRASRPRSTSTRASTTRSSTTSAPTSTTGPPPRTPGGERSPSSAST